MPLAPPTPPFVRMSHSGLGGAEAYAHIDAYRYVYYDKGWRSPTDDPTWDGPDTPPEEPPPWSSAVGSDDPYDAVDWNGSLLVPTQNVIRDLWESNPELFAQTPSEVEILSTGRIALLATIARQSAVDALSAFHLPVYVEKPSNQTISSTSATDITGLIPAVPSPGTYELDGAIYYEGTAAGGSNLALTWTPPTSATGTWVGQGPAIATAASGHIAATVISRRRTFAEEEAVGATGAGQFCAMHIFGKIICPNAGNLTPRARLDSGTDNIIIQGASTTGVGSYLRLRKIA